MDDTIERRLGAKIKAKGIYRDPVRPLSQSLCHALADVRWVLPNAVSRNSLGITSVGFTVLNRVSPIRAL